MNMQSTEYFIVLARERSFTRAAEALHITQQSLSAHIAALEEEFGTQLVLRRVPLELTYAGRVFLRRSEKIQKEYSELRQEMWGIAGEARGEIRVGIAVGRSRVLMPDVITAFQREYPNVSIMLIEESNDKLHRAALYGEIDIAISNFPASVPMLELRDFYIEGVALVIPRVLLDQCGIDAEICREEIRKGNLSILRDCPFVMDDSSSIAGRVAMEALRRAGLSVRVRAYSSSLDTLLALCERSVGACFCSDMLLHALRTDRQLENMLVLKFPNLTDQQIRFAYMKKNYQLNMLSEFMRIARETVKPLV